MSYIIIYNLLFNYLYLYTRIIFHAFSAANILIARITFLSTLILRPYCLRECNASKVGRFPSFRILRKKQLLIKFYADGQLTESPEWLSGGISHLVLSSISSISHLLWSSIRSVVLSSLMLEQRWYFYIK
jgi:hypothetical protein